MTFHKAAIKKSKTVVNLLFRGLSSLPNRKNNNLGEKLSGGTELHAFNLLSVAWVLFTEGFCGYYKHW